MKIPDVEKIPEYNRVIDYIYARFLKGLYSLILIGGKPGSGKSYSGLRLCERLSELTDISFNIKNVCDSLLSFLETVMNSEIGECILLEEISVLFPSRRSMAEENVAIAKILDTCRKKRLIIIANCPSIMSADSLIRSHCSVYLETLKTYRRMKICIMKGYKYQVNVRSQKAYFHRFKTKDGRDIHLIYCNKPSDEITSAYEKSKDEFLSKLYDRLKTKALEKEAKEIKKIEKNLEVSFGNNLTKREQQLFQLKYIENKKQVEIVGIMGLSKGRVSNINSSLKSKIKISENPEKVSRDTGPHP